MVRAGLRLLAERELRLAELRASIDAGDQAFAEGRYSVVDEPSDFAADVVARARVRAAANGERA